MLSPGMMLQSRYHIQRRLGGGGMGTVYLADDSRLPGRRCAIKELSPENIPPEERNWAIQAFRQEAGMLAKLRHPGLTAVTDFFPEGGHWYLVMDFVEGETLEAYLQRVPGGRLPLAEALEIARQLCEVLEYLHSQNPPVVFRDLKPANIMLNQERQVKMIDFGIARHFKPGQTRDTMNLGTPGYAAPEQYGGLGQSDPRTDIYSLGAVLLQLVTGYNPVLAATPFPLPPPGQLVRDLPPSVEAAIARAIQLQPEARFRSIAEFRQALFAPTLPRKEQTMVMPQQPGYPPSGYPAPAALPVSARTVAPTVQGRKKGIWIGLGGAALVVLLLCGAAVVCGQPILERPFGNTATVEPATRTVAPPTERRTEPPAVTEQPTANPTTPPLTTTEPATPPPLPVLQWGSIGRSVQGRDLMVGSIGYQGGTAVVVVGSIQGDQTITTDLVNAMLNSMKNDPTMIPAGAVFYFIPSINPDGNVAGSRYNANGVDLNRNWDTSDWRSAAPVPENHAGKPGAGGAFPFSEPETRALRDLLLELQAQGNALRVVELHASVRSPNEVYAAGTRSAEIAQIYARILGYTIQAAWDDYTPTGELLTWCDQQQILAIDVVIPRSQLPPLDNTMQALLAVAQYR